VRHKLSINADPCDRRYASLAWSGYLDIIKMFRYTNFLPVVVALSLAPCYARDCDKIAPASAATAFYAKHRDFVHSGAESPPLSKSLAKLVTANITQNLDAGDVGAIDWDFWTDAQDGEADRVAKVTSVQEERGRVIVRLSYRFLPSPTQKPVSKVTDIELVREPSGCWLVDDVLHNGQSARRLLEAGTSARGGDR